MLPRFVDSSNRPSYCSPFHLYLPVSLSTNVHPSRLSVFFNAIGFYDISLFVSSIFIQTYSAKQLLRNLKNSKNWITFQVFFPREMGHFRWPVKFSCFNSSTSWGFFSSFETWHPMSLQIIPSFFLEMREITIRLQLSEKIISGKYFVLRERVYSILLVQSWFNIRLLIGNFYEKTTTMKER